jgi:thiol:disulfide interchange protein DsbD
MKLRTAIWAILVLLALSVRAGAQDLPPDLLFQVSSAVSAKEVPAGGTFDLTVTFDLAKGIHVFKDKIAFTWQELYGVRQAEVVLPKGELADDPFAGEPGKKTEVYEGSAKIVVRFEATGKPGEKIAIKGTVKFQGCSNETCYLPMRRPIQQELAIAAGAVAPTPPKPATGAVAAPTPPRPATATRVTEVPSATPARRSGLLQILWGFVLGLGLSVTPCVYPMVPITVAIIGGRQERRTRRVVALTLLYVLGIAITYALIGLLVASVGEGVRSFLNSPYVLVPIAAIFVALALAMFDVWTLQMPASLSHLTSGLAGRRLGPFGVFLLGAVSGVVAGPCVTAPLAGLLIEIAKSGDRFLGFWTLFAVAWGMGIVLIAAGISTSLLPRAGTWMDWVKKLLGFILLWAAAYFLSALTGDKVFYALTAALLLAGAIFLGCLDSLTAQSAFGDRVKHFLGLVAVFAAAAFAYKSATLTQETVFVAGDERTVDAALRSGQPVILDFWATWCVSCKELDRETYTDPRVIKALGRFRALKIDADDNPELAQRFGLVGVPTVLLFDSGGKERKDLGFSGFKGPENVLAILEQVK